MDDSKYYPLKPRRLPPLKPPIDTSSAIDDHFPIYKGAPVEFTPFSMFVIAFHEYPDATNIEEKKHFLKMWDVVTQDKSMDFPTFFAHELNPYKDNLDRAETFYFLAR